MRTAAISRGLLFLLLAIAGCRTPHRDTVEAELRTKERQLRETQAELERSRMINKPSSKAWCAAARLGAARREYGVPFTERHHARQWNRRRQRRPTTRRYRFGSRHVLTTRTGNPVRAVGVLTVTASEIFSGGRQDAAQQLGSRRRGIAPDLEARPDWQRLLRRLEMEKAADSAKIARVRGPDASDGRAFEADKDISIRPMPMQAPPPPERMPTGPIVGPSLP